MELLEVETMDIALWEPEIIFGAVLPAGVEGLIIVWLAKMTEFQPS